MDLGQARLGWNGLPQIIRSTISDFSSVKLPGKILWRSALKLPEMASFSDALPETINRHHLDEIVAELSLAEKKGLIRGLTPAAYSQLCS